MRCAFFPQNYCSSTFCPFPNSVDAQLVNAIVRPPRADYTIEELGPAEFEYGGHRFVREDTQITNARGLVLQCSMWHRASLPEAVPCVVYTHGNASCRAEALQVLTNVLATGASLFSFDFAGCGLSQGDYISLGWFEKDDLQAAIEHLRATGLVSAIMLWGRSMGATSAVLQASRDASLAGLVLDSPFASLEQVALELVTHAPETVPGAPNIPPFLVKTALSIVARSVKGRANFDLYKLRPVDAAKTCFVPVCAPPNRTGSSLTHTMLARCDSHVLCFAPHCPGPLWVCERGPPRPSAPLAAHPGRVRATSTALLTRGMPSSPRILWWHVAGTPATRTSSSSTGTTTIYGRASSSTRHASL